MIAIKKFLKNTLFSKPIKTKLSFAGTKPNKKIENPNASKMVSKISSAVLVLLLESLDPLRQFV